MTRLLALGVFLASVPFSARAQDFTVDGVIHDAATLAPLPGAAVFILDDVTGAVLSPGELVDPAAQGQVTAEDGKYTLSVRTDRAFRISIERPSERFVFPSTTKPPLGVACRDLPCPMGQVSDSPVPLERTPYALRFDPRIGPSARNNHVPIDALENLIQVKLTPDRARTRIGDLLGITIESDASLPAPLLDSTAVLLLPPELRYIDGSARRVERARTGTTTETPLVATQRDLQLRFESFPLLPGTTKTVVRLLTRVAAARHDRKLELRAHLERGGGILISGEATARVSLDEDPVLEQSTILGTVFCEDEEGRPRWRDAAEVGLFGARVYLDTGYSAAADLEGLFHFSNVGAGTHLLKLDEGSLPPGSEPIGPTRIQLHLTPGVPAKVRFAVRCALDLLEDPVRVTPGERWAELARPEIAQRTLELTLDVEARAFELGGRADEFLAPRLSGHAIAGERLLLRFVPELDSSRTITRWLIRIEEVDLEGRTVRSIKEPLTGRGLPPPFVDFAPDRPASGAYRAWLEVEAGDYDEARSPVIDVVTSTATATTREEKTPIGRAADEAAARSLLPKLSASADPIVVEGHWDEAPDALEKSRALAERIAAALAKAGVDRERIEVRARGAEEPLVPSITLRARKQNRRAELFTVVKKTVAPKIRLPKRTAPPPRGSWMTVDGIEAGLPLGEEPKPTFTLDLDTPAQVELVYEDGAGGRAKARRVVTPKRVVRPVERVPVVPRIDRSKRLIEIGELSMPLPDFDTYVFRVRAVEGALSVELVRGDGIAAWRLALEDDRGRLLAEAARSGTPPEVVTLTSTTALIEPARLRFVAAHESGARFEQRVIALPALRDAPSITVPALELTDRVRIGDAELGAKVLDVSGRILTIGDRDRIRIALEELEALPEVEEPGAEEADVANAPAADVSLYLPRADVELERLEIPIRGDTRPENKIAINDEPVAVDAEGQFGALVALEPGKNTVVIESEDEHGNKARFERAVTTSSTSYFLLAMGDVVLSGRNADLAGSNEHTRVDLGSAALDGRAVLFGKARFVAPGPFRRISLVGKLDTGELGEAELERETGDPLRLLPAFGDGALERQEIPGHRALHLEVLADRSRVMLGSGATSIASFGDDSLFSYRRAGFGLHGEVVKSFGADDETRLRGAYTFGERGQRRGHDELSGTGGAMYWLSHGELVEGSEQVRLVVRDRDTGLVLASEDLQRGTGYEIRPREGRIALREPLPEVAGAAMIGWNRSVALSGHPIYLVADYTYEVDADDERSFGVELREELFGQVELYGAAAGEDQLGRSYRLFGLGLAWRPSAGSSIELEWARSDGRTEHGAISHDGGLTFGTLEPAPLPLVLLDAGAESFFGGLGDDAFAISGLLSLEDLVDRPELEGADPGFLRGYGQVAGLSFSSMASSREAGRLRAGFAGRYAFTKSFAIRANVDTALSAAPNAIGAGIGRSEVPALHRTLFSAAGEYVRDEDALSFEIGHLAMGGLNMDAGLTGLGLHYERPLGESVRLHVLQDALLGDDPFAPSGSGRLGTTLMLSWSLSEALSLSIAETVRWNGDNATQLGMKTRLDDHFSTYVAQRFSGGREGVRMATVLGAEDVVAEGSRTYGEYQIDGASPELSRAVLGMDNRWRVAPGVELQLSYERAQRTGEARAAVTEPRFGAPLGGLGATLGVFERVDLAGGSVSRDALSLGAVLSRSDRFKLASRFELRVEEGLRDFLVIGTHTGVELAAHRDLTLLGRLTWQRATDTETDRKYAELLEWSVGGALRPKHEEWFTLLARYTRQLIQRPIDGSQFSLRRTELRDAVSIEPIFDTPWDVQLVEKVALVATRARQDAAGEAGGLDALWINRVNARLFDQVEAGLEYRMLADLELDTVERGFLIEAGWIPDERVRVGLGYNFTSFSDEILTATARDAGGPFLRLTGRY